MKLKAYSAVCLVSCLILMCGCTPGPLRAHKPDLRSLPQQREPADEEENAQDPVESFVAPRMYPFDSLPPDARRKAWSVTTPLEALDTTQPYWMSIGPKPSVSNVSGWGHTSGRINTIAIAPDDPNVVL